jgi:hypothetical protein
MTWAKTGVGNPLKLKMTISKIPQSGSSNLPELSEQRNNF